MRAELLHTDYEIIKGQHHAAHARHGCHLVKHLRNRCVGADKHALVGWQMVDSEGFAPVGLRVGILARVVFGLRVAPSQCLEVGAGLV